MKKGLITVFTLMLVAIVFGNWIDLTDNSLQELVNYRQQRSVINIDFNLDGYSSEEIDLNGIKYTKIDYPNAGRMLQTGMPELPVFSRLIAIPDQGNVNVEIIRSRSHVIKNINIYPQQEYISESNTESNFIINNDYYQNGEIFPEEIIITDDPAIMRDLRLMKLTFCPFRFHAQKKELEIFDEINIVITTSEKGGINSKNSIRTRSRYFENLYASSVLNYSEIAEERDEFQKPSMLIIYPQYSNILSVLDYLIDWKEQKGFEVTTASTTQTGSSSSQIKSYIQDAYDNWENPPEYVLLIGDVNGSISLPSWYETWSGGNGIGDHPYSQLEGNDILADVMLGRLSVSSIYDLQTVVSKSINYEKEPYLDIPDWYNRAILYAFGGPGKIATCNTVEKYMVQHNPDYLFSKIYYNNYVFNLNQAINAGAGFICYRGQGVDDGWDNNQINSLYNGWMLPFAVFSTCYTNDFGGYSKTEAFLRAGSSTLPKGGIGSIGSSTGLTSGCFNNAITTGTFYGIFVENLFTAGAATNRGKLNLYIQYPDNQLNHVSCWSHCNNLMGDPTIDLWTGIPESMNVLYQEELTAGTDLMQINVTNQNGIPLENAWVTVRDSYNFHQTGFTDFEGICFLNIEETETGNEYEITVTAHNKIPFEGNFSINQQSQNPELVEIIFLDIDDGIPNPGEDIDLGITLHNSGSLGIYDLEAELVSTDAYITVNSAVTNFGDLAAGGEITNSDLEIHIQENAPGNVSTLLMLQLSSDTLSWNIPLFVDISGAVINFTDYAIPNSSGIINPGETENIYLTIENTGAISAEDIHATLYCNSYQLDIEDSTAYFGNLDPYDPVSNQGDTFQITAHNSIIPGTQIPVSINFTNSNGIDQTADFLLNIGEVSVTDPLGPDQYGYYCYDDGDTEYSDCPVYDWQEINNLDDPLPIYTLGDSASIADVDLPETFNFSFYGESYNSITVASSGWICPGGTDVKSFMNWQIPGPGGPNPMIAAFWDDLHYGYYSNIYTWYDSNLHIYIVEWYKLQNENNNQDETFQIILYDAMYYPTTTGDSKIKIQYQEVSNSNSGVYPYHGADHGMYCTTGLEDSSARSGLQYTYNDTYPDAAKELQNEMAILFTSMAIPESEPFITLDGYSVFSGDDQFIETGEVAQMFLTLNNIGMQNAEDIYIEASVIDQYVSMIDNIAEYELIFAGETATLTDAVAFEINENVPDYYQFTINLNITSGECFWPYSIILTAYHSNIISVDPLSIEHQIIWGEQDSTSFMITNLSDSDLNFYIRTDETTPSRDISGSYITCSTESFTPGETTSWTFTAYNASAENEWISDIWIDFPVGVTVNSATNFQVDFSEEELIWDGTSGQNAEINWHGETVNGWGLIHNGEHAYAVIDVTLSNQFAGDLVIPYTLGGDGYGSDPHQVEGEIVLEYPLRWITLNTSNGVIEPSQSQEISVCFDSSDLPEISHTCNIVITSDGWDTKTIPVTLNPVNNDTGSEQISKTAVLNQNYPNPFNPETTIYFSATEETENADIIIYNFKGQSIRKLKLENGLWEIDGGKRSVAWDGTDDNGKKVSSGIYFYRLEGKNFLSETRKMILMK